MYCGDETGAFVGDVSSYSSCFGYGGEDCPKSVLPSYMFQDGTIPTSLHHCRSRRSTSVSDGVSDTSASVPTSSQIQHQHSFQSEDDIVPIYSPYPSLTGGCSNNSNSTNSNSTNMSDNHSNPLHPDCYLQNDSGLIQNYNAYENVWMKAFNDLNVRHLGKHYHGYGNNGNANSNSKHNDKVVKMKRIYQVSSSNINDTNAKSQDDSLDTSAMTNNYQSLIHPLLAIDSGYTHSGNNDKNNSNNVNESENSIKRNQRAKITEILFESLSAPAVFIAPSPMVSSFAFGRQTSLIVDIGARGMRVTPIVDGLLLENAQRRSGRGGEWLNSIQHFVVNEYCNDPMRSARRRRRRGDSSSSNSNSNSSESILWSVHPRYACHGKKDKDNGMMNIDYPCTNIQESIFHNLAVRDVMYEMKTSPHMTGVNLYRDDDWSVPFLDMDITPMKNRMDVTASVNSSTDQDKDNKESTIESSDAMDIDVKEEKNENNDDNANNNNENDIGNETDDDPNEDYEVKSKKMYALPDGTKINLKQTQSGRDLCRLAELFFAQELPFSSTFATPTTEKQKDQPSTFSSLPIHELIKSSLTAVADADVRKELCGNIILTGASSLFPNIEQRLSLEISYLVPNMYRCKVIASRNTIERRYSPWIGGSVLTSLGSFQQLWLSKAEYEEYGAMLASQRFP